MYSNTLLIFVLTVGINLAFACNGYKAKLKKLESCAGSDQIIEIEDGFSVKLNKKCELIPTGCIKNKAFNTAKATYTVQKDGITVKEGKVNVCEAATSVSDEGKNLLKMFALPDHCPVPEGRICANENTKADLSKYKNLLSMAKGHIQSNTTIEHDTP